jgi:hypothetical protein
MNITKYYKILDGFKLWEENIDEGKNLMDSEMIYEEEKQNVDIKWLRGQNIKSK